MGKALDKAADRAVNKAMKSFAVALLLTFSVSAWSATELELEHAYNDLDSIESLQRGARNFMNYCSGCHSAKYVRFNTIGRDLELSDEQMLENLMFNAEKTFETIQANMPEEDATRWFGVAPPDLSLMARAKTTDYIYSFLKGFYLDDERPTGVNNLYLAGTSMPHVLWELQGFQTANFVAGEPNADGSPGAEVFGSFESVAAGSLSAEEFDEFVRDTANFLGYISEPIRSKRRVLGVWVLMFLGVFLILSMMLKKQIWKDVPKS